MPTSRDTCEIRPIGGEVRERPPSENMASVIKRALFAVVLGVTLYLLVPRIGGLQRSLSELRHAHLGLMIAGAAIEGAALFAYILLYRKVLAAEHRPASVLSAGQAIMAAVLIT